MRILFAIDGLGTGGAERSLAELLPHLPAAGIDPIVVCLYHRPEGVEAAVLRSGYDVRYLPGARTVARARQLRAIIESEKPDLVHTTLFESHLTGRLAAFAKPTVVLSSLVNTPYTQVRLREDPLVKPGKLRLVRAVDSWTARHLTTHFHAITTAVKDWAVDAMKIPPDRITVIERGRDPARLGSPSAARRAAARASLGLREEQEVIVNVGRQEFQKGQRYLLEAMETLSAQRPDALLLVVGREGNATSDLRKLEARPAIRRGVRFLGHREDIPDILAAADVFAFPSLYEGLGGSVIEAMALGLPMVLADVPALREVSGSGRSALLVEPASAPALVAAITQLLDDPDARRTMSRWSRQIFEERFTLERSVRRMIELYERLGAQRTTRSPAPRPVIP